VTQSDITIRDAIEEDVSFLAWVMLTAARSQLTRGIWDIMVGGSERAVLDYLEIVATTKVAHFCHWSKFIVAEVDGECAAAMSGYDPEEFGTNALTQSYPEIIERMEWTPEETTAAFQRLIPCVSAFPKNTEGVWIIENVATRPEYRRQRIVDKLLRELLTRWKAQDFELAQIGVYMENTPAQSAYERVGFKVVDEKRHPDFEKAMGIPGTLKMLLDLKEWGE